jgi:hypothetical protein
MAVTMTGPFFDGRGDAILDRMVTDIQRTVGDQAFVEFETNLELSIKHSGPRYQSFVHVFDRDGDRVVNDGYGQTNTLQYGLWLEGVGSRNYPVTRFRGYHSVSRAYTSTDSQVPELSQPIVDEAMEAINGD